MESFISHIKYDIVSEKWVIQPNSEHCQNVAELAQAFAAKYGMGDWGYLIGLLHDKGKERDSFQNYIQFVSGYDVSVPWKNENKTHAYIGAKIAGNPIASYPIMGHHSGLDDFSNYEEKINEPIPEEINFESAKSKLEIPSALKQKIGTSANLTKDLHHIVRQLFSCLVDADYLDTEAFMHESDSRLRKGKHSLASLKNKLDNFLNNLSKTSKKTPLNILRSDIQKYCVSAADCPPGFFSLTVPTGGGKTLSSLAWAMHHAIKYQKDRIIIAIPFSSIVTQTAKILGSIFGRENVLEHHSGVDLSKIANETRKKEMALATENWDYPIVVTTNVQLFESIFSNKPSKCRKLHNIANSILILDEVQTLPLKFLQPIIDSLQTYERVFGTSILFTTASLPALEGNISWGRGTNAQLNGIPNITEIIPKALNLHDKLRRVSLSFDKTESTHEEIAKRIATHPRALCIVNSRKDAKKIFEALPSGVLKFHLSRMMCSSHIQQIIDTIKTELKANTETKLWVVATQLIEAGVDIDFPIVFRQEAGLDSILQAAGRCNREGKLPMCDTFVFHFKNKPYGSIRQDCYSMESMANVKDWFAPEAMTEYFIQRYSRCENFDEACVKELLYKSIPEWNFETTAKKFKLIDDTGVTVFVNYGDKILSLIEQLKNCGPTYSLMRQLSQYSVNIRQDDFNNLLSLGLVEEIIEGCFFVSDKKQYDDYVGLVTESHWLEEILTI